MIKNKTVLEITIGERNYELLVSSDSPLGELYDAISQMRVFVINKINEQAATEQPKSE